MTNFKNKNYVVTCGSKGIGRAVVTLLLSEGATVQTCARSTEAFADLKEQYPQSLFVTNADLLDPSSVQAFAKESMENLKSIDGFVFNPPHVVKKPINELTGEDWQTSVQGLLTCLIDLTQSFLENLKSQETTSVVVISSLAEVEPIEKLAASSVLRGSMAGWLKMMAQTYGAEGIRFNGVRPGYTDTPILNAGFQKKSQATGKSVDQIKAEVVKQVPLQRLGEPNEIAKVVGFFLSEQSSFVTGTSLLVDGGITKGIS
ncbi:MAG: SDR family oxidoreductase [Deltaproteobacteria bacterium]|nr:SDR family oxidoreductase [Deltaproteobacteria bacterium]